jgi:hypothetical protein
MTEGTMAMGSDLRGVDLVDPHDSRFWITLQHFAEEGEAGGEETSTESEEGGEATETPKLAGWTAGLAADLRDQHGEYLQGYKTVSDLFRDHISLKEKAENAGPAKPGEGATEEEIAAYREKMGIPAKAEEYELGDLPKGLQRDEALDQWFRGSALEAGLNGEQAKALYSAWNGLMAERVSALQEAAAESKKQVEVQLKKEYGSEYDGNMALAKRVMSMGGPDLWNYLEESGMGNDPRMVRLFVNYGKLISEDRLSRFESGVKPARRDAAEVLYGSN